ncbi:MAG: glycoside hydrolase family 16 protein [Bacillus sp. (in: Bacteria)]|nr:glycoside hydrolase family 16 protein [Bacillus sp. (in: firmicutes)]
MIIIIIYFNFFVIQKVRSDEARIITSTVIDSHEPTTPVYENINPVIKKDNPILVIENPILTKDNPEQDENGWQLILYDEFEDPTLNSIWNAVEREKNYNNELQTYQKGNIETEKGRLNLTAKKGMTQNSNYTSGLVQTKGQLDFLYGKFEVKAKYPAGKGLFPAIWLLRSDEKTILPEIDIVEAIGQEPEVVYMVHHWEENGKLRTSYSTSRVKTYNEDHVYSMEWEREEICWDIDEKLVFSSNKNIPNKPMYLIMNLAIGGNWPGKPDEQTIFPAEFSIDYVKIYQKAGN